MANANELTGQEASFVYAICLQMLSIIVSTGRTVSLYVFGLRILRKLPIFTASMFGACIFVLHTRRCNSVFARHC